MTINLNTYGRDKQLLFVILIVCELITLRSELPLLAKVVIVFYILAFWFLYSYLDELFIKRGKYYHDES